MTLPDLIAALEAADAGSDALDGDIAEVIGWTPPFGSRSGLYWLNPDGEVAAPPKFSQSLDAALTLYKRKPDIMPTDSRLACIEALRDY